MSKIGAVVFGILTWLVVAAAGGLFVTGVSGVIFPNSVEWSLAEFGGFLMASLVLFLPVLWILWTTAFYEAETPARPPEIEEDL